ncbi:hypothetical protein P154DRAFT_521238 [Amniculicola lignicola CBS 123094]|uniref:Uncharacterized protein n=1 Tax=Amniculicola lignicola CBS 123094 TaxID=1392246 RepID=A0A6A5WSN6_9PLEO|nr:hypothetical protein P154DRAFT_521238 [Amniculicola lignicola CBS 123094]
MHPARASRARLGTEEPWTRSHTPGPRSTARGSISLRAEMEIGTQCIHHPLLSVMHTIHSSLPITYPHPSHTYPHEHDPYPLHLSPSLPHHKCPTRGPFVATRDPLQARASSTAIPEPSATSTSPSPPPIRLIPTKPRIHGVNGSLA